jgi:sugar/nucleoside kinase (ribokinase family)
VDVVAAGHICLDLVCSLAGERLALEPGSLAEIHDTRLATGGAVANTGLALQRLGVATRLMGTVGDDILGTALRDALARAGAGDTRGITTVAGASTSYTLVLTPPGGERMFLHEAGTYAAFDASAVDLDLVEGARLFHFGYPPLLPRLYADGGRPLAALLRGVRERGVTVSLDMAMPDPASPAGRVDWRAVLERTLPYTDLFMPSFDETVVLLRDVPRNGEAPGSRGRSAHPARVSRLAGELLAMGARFVLFKMGSDGVYLRTAAVDSLQAMGPASPREPHAWAERELWCPSLQTEVVNTVGAGDATCAGLIAALLRGLAPEEALSVAAAVGAYCVEAPDASGGGPSWQACRQRLDAGWPRNPLQLQDAGWQRDESTALWRGPHDRPR